MSRRLERLLFRNIRDANLKYGMITSGDRVAVAMSGGKDSLCLLYMLKQLLTYSPLEFELVPLYLDLGWDNDLSEVSEFCAGLGYPLMTETTDIGAVVFSARAEKNPCALCSNLRRGALHRLALEQGCNKVALGHHLDDLVATFVMSMLNESRIRVYQPCTYLDRSGLTLIRPLLYVDKQHILTFIASHGLHPARNNCPADGVSARQKAGDMVDWLDNFHPGGKRRILNAIEKINDPGIYGR